ncbi:hypothetical protein Nepgr_014694 [Nepenthes gracilis]|uniref:Uncharacterized protein n=1 Tax=Nepenthes gracilis TaxID=150966 RepID=A0AAD3XQ33_NEPGR|nr:hypothetical protein Nepgr_014694 [Nepenthes gracilis]
MISTTQQHSTPLQLQQNNINGHSFQGSHQISNHQMDCGFQACNRIHRLVFNEHGATKKTAQRSLLCIPLQSAAKKDNATKNCNTGTQQQGRKDSQEAPQQIKSSVLQLQQVGFLVQPSESTNTRQHSHQEKHELLYQ